MHISSAPAWSFPGKIEEKSSFQTPGPGNYNPGSSVFENSPNYRIGTSTRGNIFADNTPGPGAYKHESSVTGRPAPKIGTSKRQPLSDSVDTPGPGTYELKSAAVEGPKYTMPGRSPRKTGDNLPGPGHYDQSLNDHCVKEKAPSYRIGTEPRTERPQSAYVPGPGTYNPEAKEKGPKWAFGSQSRDNLFKIEVPGPGSYNMPESLSKRGCTMTGRKSDGSKEAVPGPGAYNPGMVRPKSPNWTLGKSPRGDFTNSSRQAPGPGAYNVRGELGKTAPLFGTSNRPPLSDVTATPGPGTYNGGAQFSSPSFTMRPRTGSKKNEAVPGPGQYNPNGSVSSGNIRWTIGKEAKSLNLSQEKLRHQPGPGQYNPNKGLGGPHWGFGSASRSKDFKTFTPGPGAYQSYSSIGNLPGYAKTSR